MLKRLTLLTAVVASFYLAAPGRACAETIDSGTDVCESFFDSDFSIAPTPQGSLPRRMLRKTAEFLTGRPSVIHFYMAKGFPAKATTFLYEASHLVMDLLSPFPRAANRYVIPSIYEAISAPFKIVFSPDSYRLDFDSTSPAPYSYGWDQPVRDYTPTEPIFLKQWQDPSYEPSTEESEVLKNYDAMATFIEKRKFMTSIAGRVLTPVHKTLSFMRSATLTLSLALALNHGLQSEARMVSGDQFLHDSRYAIGDFQIQLINETVPFPHTALRIGDEVFSYGVSHMTESAPSEYLRPSDRSPNTPEETAQPEGSSARLEGWGKALASASIGKLPRSVQVITLNLEPEEYLNLKHDLEMSIGLRYDNTTFVNDCTTMVVRMLHKDTTIRVNTLINASPSQVAMYFSVLKSAGSPLVGPIYQVDIDEPEDHDRHLWRNIYINSLESRIFIDLLFINQIQKGYVALNHLSQDFQHLDPEVAAEIEKWRDDAAKAVDGDPQILTFEKAAELSGEFAETGLPSVDSEAWTHEINDYFDQAVNKQKAIGASRRSNFQDTRFAPFTIDALQRKRAELLLNFPKKQ